MIKGHQYPFSSLMTMRNVRYGLRQINPHDTATVKVCNSQRPPLQHPIRCVCPGVVFFPTVPLLPHPIGGDCNGRSRVLLSTSQLIPIRGYVRYTLTLAILASPLPMGTTYSIGKRPDRPCTDPSSHPGENYYYYLVCSPFPHNKA